MFAVQLHLTRGHFAPLQGDRAGAILGGARTLPAGWGERSYRGKQRERERGGGSRKQREAGEIVYGPSRTRWTDNGSQEA